MPPKESAKERKEREKAELLAQSQLQERQQFEQTEERARLQVESVERQERLEATCEFFSWMVNPNSRLMVRRTEYEVIREIMQQDSISKSKQVEELTEQYVHMRDTYSALQVELVHLRAECRALSQQMKREYEQTAACVATELSQCIHKIQTDIFDHRSDTEQCGVHLNRSLEDARMRAVKMAAATLSAADKITGVLQHHQGMHTRIPRRIRKELTRLERDELLMVLDTLSFDDATLHYLQHRFPPPPDDPFAVDDD